MMMMIKMIMMMMNSGSAPSLCPSDPRAARGSWRKNWQYKHAPGDWREGGIKVTPL